MTPALDSSGESSQPRQGNEARLVTGRVLLIALFTLLGFCVTETQASAQSWSLTTAQRKAYLYYYAPIIMKRANESSTKAGLDWNTNFDFDRDGNFSNNRVNWLNINQYVAASASGSTAYSHWRIRPTLYSALIEYMEGGSKSLVMLYHVYNAEDKDGDQIHDWERVEIAVRGVTGTPGGSGEVVNHVTVTHHHDNIMRRYYDSGLNFMQTATGKHVLLWQADQNGNLDGLDDVCDTYGHELRFITNSYSTIASRASVSTNDAEVNVSGRDSAKDVNYVFVPEASQAAVDAWKAQALNYGSASSLASRRDSNPRWPQAKRITYELQDLADIIPTHWQNNAWYVHWLADEWKDILLESPIMNEAGQAEVSTGLQRFYTRSRDGWLSGLTDGRGGIPEKGWLYGAYSAELDEDCPSGGADFGAYSGSGTDSYGRTRGAASGYYASHNSYWWQHDFFVHSGSIVGAETVEAGKWLTGAWYTPANGGFDSRWVQLFDDRPSYDPSSPPTASFYWSCSGLSCTFYDSSFDDNGIVARSWIFGDGTTDSGSVVNKVFPYDGTFLVTLTVTDTAGQTGQSSQFMSVSSDPCGGDPCCGDPCCGDPCCGDPCCGSICCGRPGCIEP